MEIDKEKKEVHLGSDETVVLNKLFGPSVFANLRITADTKTMEWVIEREWINTGEYIPWMRIPGALSGEFGEDNS